MVKLAAVLVATLVLLVATVTEASAQYSEEMPADLEVSLGLPTPPVSPQPPGRSRKTSTFLIFLQQIAVFV